MIDDGLRETCIKRIKKNFKDIKNRTKPSAKDIISVPNEREVIRRLVAKIESQPKHILNMYELQAIDEYIYQHLMNTCVLSVMLGVRSGLETSELVDLAFACLYHDIGKYVDEDGKISAKANLSQINHWMRGYKFLECKDLLTDKARKCVRNHHYHDDSENTSVPKYTDMNKITRILVVANVFDAATSEHSGRTGFNAF
jgi:HD-GYP domain-containing protein (c-di-GMP phosphodiesterase class II)